MVICSNTIFFNHSCHQYFSSLNLPPLLAYPLISSPFLSSPFLTSLLSLHLSSPYLSSPHLTSPLFHSSGRPVRPPEGAAHTPCWIKNCGEICSFIGNVLPIAIMEIGLLIAGYSVAYIFHILSCGYLFRFVEFKPYSCFIECCFAGSCGWPIDRGGPDGVGFAHGRIGYEIHFPPPIPDPNRESTYVGEGQGGSS